MTPRLATPLTNRLWPLEESPELRSPRARGAAGPLPLPPPGSWELLPSDSVVHATIRHAIFSKVRIHFRLSGGTVHVAPDPERSWADACIRSASADSGDATRDRRITDPDFLDAGRYPEMTFRSSGVSNPGGDDWEVQGTLTVRGRSAPVSLLTRYHGTREAPGSPPLARFSARTAISRDTYGLTWNQALDTGGLVLGQTVMIELDVHARLRPAT